MEKLDVIIIINAALVLALIFGFFYAYYKIDKKHGRTIALIFLMAFLGMVGMCSQPSKNDIKNMVRNEVRNEKRAIEYRDRNRVYIDFSQRVSALQKVIVLMCLVEDSLSQQAEVYSINVSSSDFFKLGNEMKFDTDEDFISTYIDESNPPHREVYHNEFKKLNDSIYHLQYRVEYEKSILNIYTFQDGFTIDRNINIYEE